MCPNTLVHNYITVVKVRHPVRLVALVFPLETSVIFGNTVTENKEGRGSKETALLLTTVQLCLTFLYPERAIREVEDSGGELC